MAENSRELEAVLRFKDEFTAKFKQVATALDQNKKAIVGAQKANEDFAGSLKKMAAIAGVAFGAREVFNFFKSTIASAAESERVLAQLGAVLKSTGGAAGVTAEQAIGLAKAMQETSMYSDEAVLSMENVLLTFTNIGSDIFPKATQAVIDLSTALGGDLQGAAIQVGKALQDPILGVAALRRVGVSFNEAQTKVIENLVKTGRTAEAQQLIMEELNKEFGGSAQAQMHTYAGQVAYLHNKFDDLKEQIGRVLMPTMQVFFEGMINGFNATAESSDDLASAIGLRLLERLTRAASLAKSFVDQVMHPGEGKNLFSRINEDLETTSTGIEAMMSDRLKAKAIPNFFGGNKGGAGGGGDAEAAKKELQKQIDAIKDLQEAYKKLGDTYETFADDADESLFQLRQSHRDTMKGIRDDIASAETKIVDLRKTYRSTMAGIAQDLSEAKASNTSGLAGSVLANEERIAEIQAQLKKGVNRKARQELEAELSDRQKAVTDNAAVIASIDTQLVEARRVAGLTDLQRAVEEFTQKQALAQAEYESKAMIAALEYKEKKKQAEQELKDLKEKKASEQALYTEKKNFINAMVDDVAKHQRDALALGLKNTKESIAQELELYAQLASAINYARGGNAAEVSRIKTKVKDAVISPGGQIVSTDPQDWLIATKNPGGLGGGGMQTIILQLDGKEVSRVVFDQLAGDLKREVRV